MSLLLDPVDLACAFVYVAIPHACMDKKRENETHRERKGGRERERERERAQNSLTHPHQLFLVQSFPLVAGLEWSVTGLPRKGKGAASGGGGGIDRATSMMNAGSDGGLMTASTNKPTGMSSPTQRYNHRGAPESSSACVWTLSR